jgi:hypothetical protein
MVNCNVLNDVSKCYYVAEMDEINIISYHMEDNNTDHGEMLTCSATILAR